MRVVVADDMMLVRSGLVRLLTDAGVEVVGEAADSDALMRLVALERPDAATVDIRMPPTHKDEGLIAARRIRERYPTTAVVVLSQYLEARYALRLLADQPSGLGYLLKERVSDIAILVDAMRRVTEGECVVDPTHRVPAHETSAPGLTAQPPHAMRARDSRSHGRGPVQRRHRRRARGQRTHRRDSLCPGLPQARPRAITGRQPPRFGSAHVAPQLRHWSPNETLRGSIEWLRRRQD